MATYKQIQEYVRDVYGYSPKTCWIAHMKDICSLHPKVALNRFSLEVRTHPCPANKQADIREAFVHFNMI